MTTFQINKYLILFFSIIILGAFLFIKLESNENFLNFFARYYFDDKFYLKEYPDVASHKMSPFEHYVKIGWHEDKNPNPNFNTKFYKNMYMIDPFRWYHYFHPLAEQVSNKMFFGSRLINQNQLEKAHKLPNPKYYLALVAMFQNEARFLKEWIEFYKLQGVEKFYLYNHKSSDNFQEVLDPYVESGLVELRNLDYQPVSIIDWDSLQTKTYTEVSRELSNTAEWLIVVDTDEFLFPVKEHKLSEVLGEYDDYAALSVNWIMFTSHGLEKIQEGDLMIDSLKQVEDCNGHPHVKTIVKPRYVEFFPNPHFPILKKRYAQINENKEYFAGMFFPEVSAKILRINHYIKRDLEFLKTTKLNRFNYVKNEGVLNLLAKVIFNGYIQKGRNKLNQDEIDQAVKKEVEFCNNLPPENIDNSITKYSEELRDQIFNHR